MQQILSRRDFLKLGALSLGGLAFRPPAGLGVSAPETPLGRVTIESVSVYSQPWDESSIVQQRYRDQLVHLYYKVNSEHGPEYNPIWYRVWGGYIHSARLQLVEERLNPLVESLPETGQLGEITVPVSQPYVYTGQNNWQQVYPLYFQSVHWITDLIDGPDGGPWYQIKEAWSNETYYVPAQHVRLFSNEEIAPISPEVPHGQKRIEVSIARQTLTAYESEKIVLQTRVSTGLNRAVDEGEIPWNTPTGEFHIYSKMPSKRMGNGDRTSDIAAYELPGVPWVCFFHETGVATHGTYWHTNYGTPMSHGCVNMTSAEALWLFRWTHPVAELGQREAKGFGTRVTVV
jgi:hypothetical protein